MSRRAGVPASLGIPSQKIVAYLLNKDHPQGGSKARFFLGFGFSPANVMEFADALFAQAGGAPDVEREPSAYGTDMLTCIGPIGTPSGRRPWIKSVWLVSDEPDEEVGRFITAFPARDPSA